MMRANVARAGLIVGAMAALALPSAASAETTRAEYVAQAEPICQANTTASIKILEGVRAKVKKGKFKQAGGQFLRASRAFGATVNQIAAIPQPSADAATLATWIKYLRLETTYLRKIGKALKAEKGSKAQGFVIRLSRNANLANDTVASFGFNHCLINPSKFT